MNLEFWAWLLDNGAVVTLAIFAIWMLQREYKQQLSEGQEDRRRLIAVVERNTEAWAEATRTMTSVAAGIAVLAESVNATESDINKIRVLLARRPCIGDEAIEYNGD